MRSNHVCRTLLYLGACLWGLSFWGAATYDPDLGWHLLGGAFTVEHGEVPRLDIINSFNAEWHDYHWLAQAGMYLLFEQWSYLGLSIGLGILVASYALLLVDICLALDRKLHHPWVIAATTVLSLALLLPVTSVRPQMLALFFVALALRRLIEKPLRGEAGYLFLLTVLAVNVHVYWVFIPILWCLYRIVPLLFRPKRHGLTRAFLSAVFLSLAGLVSPYGFFQPAGPDRWIWKNYALLLDYTLMPAELRSRISELVGSLAHEGTVPYLLLAVIVVGVRCFNFRRFRARPEFFLCSLFGLLLALRATKFLAIFSLLCVPYLVLQLSAVTREKQHLLCPDFRKYCSAAAVTLFLLVGAIRAIAVFPTAQHVMAQIEENLPVHACTHIASLPAVARNDREEMRVLTHFNYGGWCRWVTYQQAPERDIRVTTDGRTQWVPPDHYRLSFDLFNVKGQWLETLTLWNPDVILVPKDRPLAQVLFRLRDQWRLVFEDASFAVYVPAQQG